MNRKAKRRKQQSRAQPLPSLFPNLPMRRKIDHDGPAFNAQRDLRQRLERKLRARGD